MKQKCNECLHEEYCEYLWKNDDTYPECDEFEDDLNIGEVQYHLNIVPTTDLVAELEKRDGVEFHGISESYHVTITHEIECLDPIEVFGPAKILVVR